MKISLQILGFLAVGLGSAAIDITVTQLTNWAGAQAFLASGLGFSAGFLFGFPLNRKKIFQHSSSDRFGLFAQIWLYISLAGFNLVFSSLFVEVVVANQIPIVVGKVAATAIIACWNFIIMKYFVFSKLKNHSSK